MVESGRRFSQFSDLARALSAAPDETARLELVVDAAVLLVDRCDHAGITNNERCGPLTRVSSDDVVRRANVLQQEIGEGPCLDVMRDQDTLVSTDLDREHRWPRWAPRVSTELGVGSMMSLLIYTDHESFGALSLYARRGQHFDDDDVAIGQALANQLAVTIGAEREIEGLSTAMHNRLIIGRAEGILMERLDITADQAMDYLRRVSSHTNRKLVALAADIAETRQLPELE